MRPSHLPTLSCTPAYLIDTENDCIVEVEAGVEYVALSYRWGDSSISFRTKKHSLADLTVPGGISKQINIPHTIIHAMQVVRSLGERYLWADSLCIISDDRKHFQEQLEIMGSIYRCAKLTIVSADGDAWDGLHGIENVSQPRRLPNVFPWLDGTMLVVRDLPALSAIHSRMEPDSGSEYFQRGWTFQEYILSRRRLIFGKRQIHWRCACAAFHEDRPNEEHDPDNLPESSSYLDIRYVLSITNILAGLPDFQELELVANEYHMRVFTHPEDALPGLTGLLNLFSYSFMGGFLCGLPVMTFDAALMWNCDSVANVTSGYADPPLQARKHSMNQSSDLSGAILPSWSWVSWQGESLTVLGKEESYELPDSIYDDEPRYITTPVTTWYSQDAPFSHTKWRIYSFLDHNEDSSDTKFVDQGWIKEPFDPAGHFRDGRGSYLVYQYRQREDPAAPRLVYHHPDFPNKFFWRPFSKSAPEQHEKHSGAYELQQRQYISCRTWRNWFHARRRTMTNAGGFSQADSLYSYDVPLEAQILIVNDSDQACGWLQGHGEPGAKGFQDGPSKFDHAQLGPSNPAFEEIGPTIDQSLSRSKIELVTICCRRKSNVWNPYGSHESGKQFYGVLWVEWKDKVAYRRGCGYIGKETWDQSGADEVDLVLG